MLTFAWYMWPVIWAMIAVGALVTVALCVAVAKLPAARVSRRMPANVRYAHRHAPA